MKRKTEKQNQNGVVIVLFAFAITAVLLVLGLAIDLGVAYVASSAMSKSVDAGVLAGARYSNGTTAEIEALAVKIAEANFPDNFIPVSYKATVTIPALDTIRVRVDADSQSPALFSKIIGKDHLSVRSGAEATRYPLDMSLVLDISYSLESNNVFDDMQVAATAFLAQFNEAVDQVGLVTYSQAAKEEYPAAKNFRSRLTNTINGLSAILYTNIEDGLELGKFQLDTAPLRDNAIKVLVLFTDGRPTAFSDDLYMGLSAPLPEYYHGVVSAGNSGSAMAYLYQKSDGRKVVRFNADGTVTTAAPTDNRNSSQHMPRRFPGGLAANGTNVRRLGIELAEAHADAIRAAGYTIYVVGLGNPNARDASQQPDLPFLRRLANEGGLVSRTQPKGEMIFAPTAAELKLAFDAVADRILTRLTR